MAKIIGPGHADALKGKLASTTFRTYRGTAIASNSRMPVKRLIKPYAITKPEDIPGCFARFNAALGITKSGLPPNEIVKFWNDQIGGFGTLTQLASASQPKWFPTDPARNNQPYIIGDGINDRMATPPLVITIQQPLDIWIIGADVGTPTTVKVYFGLNSLTANHIAYSPTPTFKHYFNAPPAHLLAPDSNSTTKLWRITLTLTTIQIAWNTIPQSIPKPLALQSFNQLHIFSFYIPGYFASYKLFEIAFWRRILTPIESALLTAFYYERFKLP